MKIKINFWEFCLNVAMFMEEFTKTKKVHSIKAGVLNACELLKSKLEMVVQPLAFLKLIKK